MPEILENQNDIAVASYLEAAAGLLLREPDDRVRDLLRVWSPINAPSLANMRHDFWDVMCIPQSGRYVPPYEHVVHQAQRQGRFWFFPSAKYDGGRLVEEYYACFGFDRRRLEVAPVFRASHLPGDHLGFMLAFAAFLMRRREAVGQAARAFLDRDIDIFIRKHFGGWVEIYASLLEDRGGPYLEALAYAVRDAAAILRDLSPRTSCRSM